MNLKLKKKCIFLPEGIPMIPSIQYSEIWKAPNSPISRNMSSINMMLIFFMRIIKKYQIYYFLIQGILMLSITFFEHGNEGSE